MVVVHGGARRLEHHLLGAADDFGIGAARLGPLEEDRLQHLAREDPLHARGRIAEQRFDEQPLALDVEADVRAVGAVEGEPVGADVTKAGRRNGRTVERRPKEQQIGVDAAAVRSVSARGSAVARGQIADVERWTWTLGGNGGGCALDRRREAREGEVAIVVAEPAHRVRLFEHDAVHEDPSVRRPERAVDRHGVRAAPERAERDRQSQGGTCSHRRVLPDQRFGKNPAMRPSIAFTVVADANDSASVSFPSTRLTYP